MTWYSKKEMQSIKNIDDIQSYIQKYFYRIINPTNTILFLDNNRYHRKTEAEIKSILPSVIQSMNFHPYKWFIDNTDEYELVFDPKLPKRIAACATSRAKINESDGLPYHYAKDKKYNDYSQTIKDGVQKILDHILIVLCSNNNDSYNYVMNYFSYVCTGERKVISCLFMKSLEGTGKSIILSFLQKIISENLSSSISNISELTGTFNYSLCNKYLVLFEELPCISKGEWQQTLNILKNFITKDTIVLNKKYEKPEPAFTPYGVIITSNNEVIKLGIHSRRYHCLDISDKYVGNVKYFDELAAIMAKNEIAEAFYVYMLEVVQKNKNWNEAILPPSQYRIDNQNNNLLHEYVYLKENYIKLQKHLILPCSELHENYNEWALFKKYHILSNIDINNSLKDIGIHKKKSSSHNGKYIYNYTCEQLYKIFNDKKMIHELDEIDDLYNNNISSSDDETIINKLNTLSKHKLHKLYNIIKNKIDEPIIIPKTDNFIDDIDNKIIVENNILDDGEILISHDKCNNNMLKVKHILNNFEKNKIFKIKK